jgi:hypothetical protein
LWGTADAEQAGERLTDPNAVRSRARRLVAVVTLEEANLEVGYQLAGEGA